MQDDPDHLYFREHIERYLDAAKRGEQTIWERADIALEVDTTYGQGDFFKFCIEVKEPINTVMVHRWVARQYPPNQRNPNLSFRHHQILGARDDRFEWLKKAEVGRWTAFQLLQELKPTRVERQEARIQELIEPKKPDEYTLREIAALDLEDRHRILEDAEFETTVLDDLAVGLTMLDAVNKLNWWMANRQAELITADLLKFMNILYEDVGSFSYDAKAERFHVKSAFPG